MCRAANKMAPPSDEVVGLCNVQSFIMLCVLPFFNIMTFLWAYTALPLAWLDQDWPLWQLALLLTVAYVPRVAGTVAIRYIGDWLCVVGWSMAAVFNTWMLLRPTSLPAVWAATIATASAVCPTAHRSLVYSRFLGSGEWQMQRALRIYTFADTLGYACAPFIGGLLYDSGGLRACAAALTLVRPPPRTVRAAAWSLAATLPCTLCRPRSSATPFIRTSPPHPIHSHPTVLPFSPTPFAPHLQPSTTLTRCALFTVASSCVGAGLPLFLQALTSPHLAASRSHHLPLSLRISRP